MNIRSCVAVVAATVSLVACNETSLQSTGPTGQVSKSIQAFDCTVNVASATLSCAPSNGSAPSGLRAVQQTVGGQGVYVKIASSNVSYNGTTQIFSFNTTIQNYTNQPMATANGTQGHPGGVKIFFHTGPSVTGGTGSVTVANAAGTANFTGTNQPYFVYGGNGDNSGALGADGILSPGEISSAETWQLSMPPTVASFTFQLLVSTQMPSATYSSQPPTG